MDGYNVILDPVELISGVSRKSDSVYIETAKTIENDNSKSDNYIKQFITSIEKKAEHRNVKIESIIKSKGNIKTFSGYNNINAGLSFLSKNIRNKPELKSLNNVKTFLENNVNLYSDGYNKHIRIIELEYETALYMLVTGISFMIAAYTDIEIQGDKIKVVEKPGRDKGIILSIINKLSSELNKSHITYLKKLIDAKDNINLGNAKFEAVSPFVQAAIDTIDLVKALTRGVGKTYKLTKSLLTSIYKSMFGILPLIRSIIYLNYKRKVDSIISLEEQIHFIEMNIDQLKNIKTMDPKKKEEIIKKQQAEIEARKKKSEKLRAQFIETEKEASEELKRDEPEVSKDSTDDFILD